MGAKQTDKERRRFLTAATATIGGIGLGFASTPFLRSWLPSAKAQALGAPVEVDISKVEVGQKITIPWRGQPVLVIHRSEQAIASLTSMEKQLRDPLSQQCDQPEYITAKDRALNDKYLVLIGLCTHLGCVPLYKPQPGSVDAAWKGGFFCPCHGSKFDMAGRVFKGVPAPTNLSIPPYRFEGDSVLVIGEDPV